MTTLKRSGLHLMLQNKLASVGMMCLPSMARLQCMQAYSIHIDGLEHPFEVILPTHVVATSLAKASLKITEEALRDYTVPIIDAVAYALAFYWSMPGSVKKFLEQLGEIGQLRVRAIEHMKRFYGVD